MLRVRLVTVANELIGTTEIPHVADVIVFAGDYFVPTGLEHFDQSGVVPIWRRAEAVALLHCDVVTQDVIPRGEHIGGQPATERAGEPS